MRAAAGQPPWRTVRWAAAYLGLVSCGLCAVPLFDLLGYAFCLALAIAQVPAALAVGLAAERKAPRRAVAGAGLGVSAALLPSLGIVLANALRVRNCNVLAGLGLFVALPWASAWYGASVAAAGAALWRRVRGRAAPRLGSFWVVAGFAATTLGYSLLRLYLQAPVSVYDHLWGHFAGPIYDEQVRLDAPFVAFRAATALRVALACAVARWAARGPGPSAPAWALAPAVGACALAIGLDVAAGPRLGYRVDRPELQRVLAQTWRCRGVVVHLSPSLDVGDARRLAHDHAFRLAQARRRLQLPHEDPEVHSYVFPDAEAKARWTGARHTMVAKPWLHEIYLHGEAVPHPLLAHEMVHAALGPSGQRPFATPRHGLFGINVGLTEGVAEAIAFADRPLDGAEVAACTYAGIGRQPMTATHGDLVGGPTQLEAAMGGRIGAGAPPFWAQPGWRAYATTGAFASYLLGHHGPAAMLQRYGGADWMAAFGAPLPQLVRDFGDALARVPPAQRTCDLVRATYAQPSLFHRVCAHEVAALKARQAEAEPRLALALQRKLAAWSPDDAREQVGLALRLFATRDPADAEEAQRLLAAAPAREPALAATVYEAEAAALAHAGKLEAAAEQVKAALVLPIPATLARTLLVRRWSLAQPQPLRAAVDGLLSGGADPWRLAATLAEAAAGGDATASYLLGRQMFSRGQRAEADHWLRACGPHPQAPLEAERLRMLTWLTWRARFDARYLDAATQGAVGPAETVGPVDFVALDTALKRLLAELEAEAMPADARRLAADWRERTAFEDAGEAGCTLLH